MECPRCLTPNPDTSKFCSNCALPLASSASGPSHPGPAGSAAAAGPAEGPPEVPAVTKTIETHTHGMVVGAVVAGKYRIVRQIGRGGMGVVYEADDLKLRRPVALKFLPAELTYDAEARERFIHEAQTASVLDHPHICTIYEIGESETGQMYIAMALCQGETLRAVIKRGPLDPSAALTIAVQVAEGLAAAHEHDIVHRDIKPGNILMMKDGTARIADFGLAKLAGGARLTRPGAVVGTVAYMSPEQLCGADADQRTDIWSLGVVLFEMLSGVLPFHGDTEQSLAYAIVNSEPDMARVLPAALPPACRRIVEKALAKDPADRFGSAREMAEALAAVRGGSGYAPRETTRAGEHEKGPGKGLLAALKRIAPVAGIAAAALALAFAPGVPAKVARWLGLKAEEPGRHVAILPLSVLGGGGADERAFADGLAEHIRRALNGLASHARRPDSFVIPLATLQDYDVREAADASRFLGANAVVSGTLKRDGENLVVKLEALDPAKLRRLTTLSKSDHIANLATWQEDIVLDVAAACRFEPSAGDKAVVASDGTTVPGAFESYLRGLGYLSGPLTAANADGAIRCLEEAVARDPSFLAAGVDLADAYWAKNLVAKNGPAAEKAEAQARAMLKMNEKLAHGHVILGRICRGTGREREAVKEFERAVEIDPSMYEGFTRLGDVHEDLNEPAKAEAAYRSALKLRPGYAMAHSILGYFYFLRGAFDKARASFLTITKICPDNTNALDGLGACYYELGDYSQAEAAFERSNSIKRHAIASSNLAVIYYFRGRYADSVTAGEAAIGLGADDYQVWGNLADAYRFTPGNEAKAEAAYRKAVELVEKGLAAQPQDFRMQARLAGFLAKLGSSDKARTEIAEALRTRPDDSFVVLKSVFVFELIGDRQKALEALREYARLKGPMDEVVKDPFLAGLRKDEKYRDLMKSLGVGPAGAPKKGR
jgi:tetratricopeptide (TPR) repeat protein/TolB-like protein